MIVRVRLFAQLRDRAGARELELDLPEGARVRDALAAPPVTAVAAGLPLVMAINREYAREDAELHGGDELALIPPVSGGAGPVVHSAVVDAPLSLDRVVALVRDPRAGAVVSFSGVTRDVDHLDYEAYAEMAEPVMRAIAQEALERHGLCAVAVEHRVGRVALGEASIVIAASAPHRAEAFAGARAVIDEVKARAPVWKREEGEWKAGSVPA